MLTDGTLGVEEAAQLCGVSDETIRRRLRAGRLPNAVRAAGASSAWRIPLSDLIADGFQPQTASGEDGTLAELERLRAALDGAERLLAERLARIDELQTHVADLRRFLGAEGVGS